MRESTLEKKVVNHCKDRGICTYKFSSPSHRGVPDRIMMKDGRVLMLELKSDGKKPTPLQLREMAKLNESGVTALWCDNYSDAVSIIDEFFPLVEGE